MEAAGHAASSHPWLLALEHSPLGAAMRQSLVFYPAAEVIHILGFILLVGSIAGFDLRLLGLTRGLPLLPFFRHAVPLAVAGLCVAIPSGVLLFATEATSIAVNPAFQLKLVCVVIGLVNAAIFHIGPWRGMASWGAVPPAAARAGAVVSLAAWCGAVVGGRLIAYL